MDRIRVSAAGLARIVFDEAFLVALNHTALEQGDAVYTPLGGALEYGEQVKPFLEDDVEAVFEKDRDLRFTCPRECRDRFTDWFYRREQRETDPYRELVEELVDETAVLEELPRHAIDHQYKDIVEQRSAGTGRAADQETHRYFEVYDVTFAAPWADRVLDAASSADPLLTLVSEDEIVAGETENDVRIGSNCEPLLTG